MKVFLVRHGQSQDRVENRKQTSHTPLSKLGLVQADAVAKRLQDEEIQIIVSSPMNRALQTAEAISSKINIPVTQNDLLREMETPSIDGVLFSDQLHKKFSLEVEANAKNIDWKFEEGDESFRELLARANNLKLEIISKYQGRNILLVSHGFLIICLITVTALEPDSPDKSLIDLVRFPNIGNTGISELEYQEDKGVWRLNLLNDHLHIRGI